jgi:hypothetical protein
MAEPDDGRGPGGAAADEDAESAPDAGMTVVAMRHANDNAARRAGRTKDISKLLSVSM